MSLEKAIIVDTSVILHNPESLEEFGDKGNVVIIPIWVVEELDMNKKGQSEKAANARQVARILDKYRERGSLHHETGGVETERGGRILIDYRAGKFEGLLKGLGENNDNRVILVAQHWQKEKPLGVKNVCVVSKDVNLRLKADALGIPSQDYWRDKVATSGDGLYSGCVTIKLPPDRGGFVSDLGRSGVADATAIWNDFDIDVLFPNQCCQFELETGKVILAIYKKKSGVFRRIKKPETGEKAGRKSVGPINFEQAFAYSLLMDNDIKIVSLVGKAGTGKTLISLLAGLEMLLGESQRYEKIMVYRPNIPLGNDIGYLPGDIDEKFAPWKQPIYDNLRLIGNSENGLKIKRGGEQVSRPKRSGNGNGGNGTEENSFIEDLEYFGWLEIAPIVFARGRSLLKKYIIIDESQNLTSHEAKTLITRVGDDSKVILTGDLDQIDNPYLDSSSSGLAHVVEGFKGQEVFGHIVLRKGERSLLAELASQLL